MHALKSRISGKMYQNSTYLTQSMNRTVVVLFQLRLKYFGIVQTEKSSTIVAWTTKKTRSKSVNLPHLTKKIIMTCKKMSDKSVQSYNTNGIQ